MSSEVEPHPEFLYRFRPLARILDQHELENQEIFFSAPSALNDPMEGYLDVFWEGDRVVWKNLFRHYLLCLQRAYVVSRIGGPTFALQDHDIQVFLVPHELPEAVKLKYDNICAEFLESEHIGNLVDMLDSLGREVRRDELLHYMKALHPYALSVLTRYEAPEQYEKTLPTLPRILAAMKNLLGAAQKLNPATPPDLAFNTARIISDQHELMAIYNAPSFVSEPGKRFVVVEFPWRYVEQLERIMYPPWYATCFMGNVQDASLWAQYGDNHQGVCLKFRTTKSGSRDLGMNLRCITSYSAKPNEPVTKRWGSKFFKFHQVSYESRPPKIDFFRSIGSIPFPSIMRYWYSDDGQVSKCSREVFGNESRWRDRLWKNLTESSTIKLNDWSKENEYRLLLLSHLSDLADKQDRLLKYEFSDLDGIVFGIKTPLEKKVEIIRIIEQKCKANKRDDFKLFQSAYSPISGKIEIIPLTILRFKPES